MFVTAVCFLSLLQLKWPKNENIYDVTFARHGHKMLKLVQDFEGSFTFQQSYIGYWLSTEMQAVPFLPQVPQFQAQQT